jgi:hypothetical protein
MSTYASSDELESYLEASDVRTGADLESLLIRAEGDVDRALGPYPVDPTTGLKLDPASLTTAQKASLSRAVCAAAEWRITISEKELIGGDDFVPSELRILRTGGRVSPKMLEALAGSGLVSYSGTVSTT